MCTKLARAVFAMTLAATTLSAVEIIAHRGASYDAPENTLASMRLAWEQRADAIELDLWLSKDGRLVVIHDADTKRLGGPARRIAEQTWKEIQRLDVGAWKDPRFKGERVPALESILATIPPGRRAVLEIKCGPEILPELERALAQAAKTPEEIAIIAFDFDTLRRSKETLPQFPHYWLQSYKKDAKTGRPPEFAPILAQALTARFDGLNLHFDWPIDAAFVAQLRAAQLKLLVWTVNDPRVARRLVDAGVDGITTDRPQWLRERLQESGDL
ncbi:MAG: glycerophosphodiester phosphodiesterase [Akkermansiaceae bacterium]|jgi:glycerophosphoryl diester phosphodiesterase|nr:glycerophosphodiester phosphodiesterase [Akkermansiaceae bacterium]